MSCSNDKVNMKTPHRHKKWSKAGKSDPTDSRDPKMPSKVTTIEYASPTHNFRGQPLVCRKKSVFGAHTALYQRRTSTLCTRDKKVFSFRNWPSCLTFPNISLYTTRQLPKQLTQEYKSKPITFETKRHVTQSQPIYKIPHPKTREIGGTYRNWTQPLFPAQTV